MEIIQAPKSGTVKKRQKITDMIINFIEKKLKNDKYYSGADLEYYGSNGYVELIINKDLSEKIEIDFTAAYENESIIHVCDCSENKKEVERIEKKLYQHLKSKSWSGFIQTEYYLQDGEQNYFFSLVPVGERAKEIHEIIMYMSNNLELEDITYHIKTNDKKFKNSYKLHLELDENNNLSLYILTDYKKNKGIKIETMEDLNEFLEAEKIEAEKVKKILEKQVNILKNKFNNVFYDDEILIIFGEKNNFFGRYIHGEGYKARVFGRTLIAKKIGILEQKIESHVENYIKKNRIKKVINGGVMNDLQKFYYKATGRLSKTPGKVIIENTTTNFPKEELLDFIKEEMKEEQVEMTKVQLDKFKEELGTRGNLKGGFVSGSMKVAYTTSKIFVKKVK